VVAMTIPVRLVVVRTVEVRAHIGRPLIFIRSLFSTPAHSDIVPVYLRGRCCVLLPLARSGAIDQGAGWGAKIVRPRPRLPLRKKVLRSIDMYRSRPASATANQRAIANTAHETYLLSVNPN
jgi:hypothetical protein